MKYSIRDFLEFAGLVSVVASLLFVAAELRQANTLAERDSALALTEHVFDLNNSMLNDPEMATLMSKLRDSNSNLTPAEFERAHLIASNFINFWAAVNASMESGLLQEATEAAYLESVTANVTTYPGLKIHIKNWLEKNGVVRGRSVVFDRIWTEIEK